MGGDFQLLKLDIEGAEMVVLDAMVEAGLLPSQLLVEFDEIHFPTRNNIEAVKQVVLRLENVGYELVHYDGIANCVFYRHLDAEGFSSASV